jgi:hypothetical protein
MRKLAFIILAVSLTSIPAAAQSNTKCPAGYELVGTYCQSKSTGDVVLPN